MNTTETNGNARNGIRGTRLSIWDDTENLIDRFEVPVKFGRAREYCEAHPTGQYGVRVTVAMNSTVGRVSLEGFNTAVVHADGSFGAVWNKEYDDLEE